MYDSVAGRFCSRDPIGYRGSEWGLYEYVGEQPLDSVDPLGESKVKIVIEVCKFAGRCCQKVWRWVRPKKPIKPPFKGKPNTTVKGKKQTRTYGPDGKPKIDRDFPHKGGPKIEKTDHSHDWPGGKRGPARPPKKGDPPPPEGMD
jgi:uncharacterized protein RhaS with RHS repeats